MLPVSLDCPFLISPLVFSTVYSLQSVLCLMYPMLSVSLDCPFLISPFLEKTKGEIKNGQSRETDNIGYTRHRTDYPMLPVSLDCPFLISPLVFSKVYSLQSVLCLMYPMLSVYLDCPFLISNQEWTIQRN
jgi:Fe-S-cluster containining protein